MDTFKFVRDIRSFISAIRVISRPRYMCMSWLLSQEVEGTVAELQLSKTAAKQEADAQGGVSIFVRMKPLDVSKETLWHFPAVFVPTGLGIFEDTSRHFPAMLVPTKPDISRWFSSCGSRTIAGFSGMSGHFPAVLVIIKPDNLEILEQHFSKTKRLRFIYVKVKSSTGNKRLKVKYFLNITVLLQISPSTNTELKASSMSFTVKSSRFKLKGCSMIHYLDNALKHGLSRVATWCEIFIRLTIKINLQ